MIFGGGQLAGGLHKLQVVGSLARQSSSLVPAHLKRARKKKPVKPGSGFRG